MSTVFFVKINNIIFFENRLIKKIHPSGNIYGYKSDCSNFSTSEIIFKDSYLFYSQNNEEECKESGKLIRENQIQLLAEYFGSMRQNC